MMSSRDCLNEQLSLWLLSNQNEENVCEIFPSIVSCSKTCRLTGLLCHAERSESRAW